MPIEIAGSVLLTVKSCSSLAGLPARSVTVAAMVADLVSQSDSTSKTDLTDVFAIGDLIMAPFASSSLTQRVSSVTRVNATTYKVDWSVGKGISSKLTVAQAKVPSDMLANGESVIVAEAFYDYKSPFDRVAPYVTKFSRMAYLRPRTVEMIPCSGC